MSNNLKPYTEQVIIEDQEENEIYSYMVKKIDDDILVIINDVHPLMYPYEFGEVLQKLTQDIDKNEIQVYMDFSKWKNRPVIKKILYLKDINNIDVHSGIDIKWDEVPENIKKELLNNDYAL